MGVVTEFLTMDTKPGYCHGSSGKLMNHYMIKDHMFSHYRKLYSAKAAVDCSVPKSMQCNVKYVDQKRVEQLKKDSRSRTGRSESQRSTRFNSRASCSSKNSGASAHGDNTLEHSAISPPRISTSFQSKQIVYPSQTALGNHFRSSSELQGYRSPNLLLGHLSSVGQRQYKTFQDPTQKTYSGDVLLKHAHRFTQEKLFTPRTLKSNHKSTLLQYRYYTPPKRKDEEKRSSSFQMTRQESSESKGGFSQQLDSAQAFSVVHEWSDEESDSFRRHRTADFLLSSSRLSPEGMKSPIMRKVSAEEEELMYLEFITDVTNEILAQGLYSDRVLKRVFERHVDMNRHRLDENKLRHLLDNLHNDLQKPSDVSVSFLSIYESDKPLNLRQGHSSVIRDDAGFVSHAVFDEVRGQRENITYTPVNDSLLEGSSSLHLEKVEKEPELNLEINRDAGYEMSLHESERVTCAEEHLRNTARDNELLEQVDEIGKSMIELLKVSEIQKTQFKEEQMTDKLSDEEF
ncbi:Spermatogenesis-associated protein 7 -like protein [Triplophysa tibetana]|uniref:Spermatogenesis-associated protein 7-like protein n=1 Tax=Triplophysa tibetana TaxID=1572043 RepID=A0A5A9NPJ5_9TELE|nr:Spermatogenesis-associated protein 7 -like protein [Triplophysa tibetana]